jgi:exportin-T
MMQTLGDQRNADLSSQDLRGFIDSVIVIDQDLVTGAIHQYAVHILKMYREGQPVPWTEAELAVYLVYSFGEINKTGPKGRPAFVQVPAVAREQRKEVDYSSCPLTAHGEMLVALMESNISAYPHTFVVMQFFETISRYGDFFKVRKECIVPALEAMVDKR